MRRTISNHLIGTMASRGLSRKTNGGVNEVTRKEAIEWSEKHPIGSVVAVMSSPYVIEEGDHGHCRKVCNRHYEASIIMTRPFVFAGKSCVKLFGFGDRPIFISRIQDL